MTQTLINGINELFSELKVHTRGGTVIFVDEVQSECFSWNASVEALMKKGAITVMDMHQSASWVSVDTLTFLFDLKQHQRKLRVKKPDTSEHKKKKKHADSDDEKASDDDEDWGDFGDDDEEETVPTPTVETPTATVEIDSDEEIEEPNLFAPIKALFFVGMLSPRNERAIKKAIHTYAFEHVVVLCSHSDIFAQVFQQTSNENYLTFGDLREKATVWAKEAQMLKLKEKFNESTFEP
jgi:hypothetical protein